MNQARAEELRLPYRAEELRREAAYRIQGLTRERRFDGFGSIVLNRAGASLTLYWMRAELDQAGVRSSTAGEWAPHGRRRSRLPQGHG